MSAAKCDACYSHRWLWYAPKFGAKGLEGAWRPFVRDLWDQTPKLVQAAALAQGALKPCTCNPNRLAPWAKEWDARGALPTEAEANGTPF